MMNDHRSRFMGPKEGTLAVAQYLRDNAMNRDKLVHSMVIFYQEDDISRMRANSRDVVKTHHSEVRVRFVEMTLLDVIHEYDRCFPSFTRCSTFFSLRIRHVKIVSSDATRLSISHEKMHILPRVSAICISYY